MTASQELSTRLGGRASTLAFGIVTGLTGLLPPRIRYGYVHRITRVILHKPVPTLCVPGAAPHGESTRLLTPAGDIRCVLAASPLDVGGIGSVVELLASRLPTLGVSTAVVCTGDGPRADRIRALGIEVRSVTDRASATRALGELRPDVIQLHGAPDFLDAAAKGSGVPLVPVMHNTEIHYSRARWRSYSRLLAQSSSAVAVSELVRSYHAAHLAAPLRPRIAVIPNAVPGRPAPDEGQRRLARELLERAVGVRFHDDVVFVCLARYDAQKNLAGTVASFLSCVADGVPARLVIAGEPSDWVEFRRSDALRRGSHHADRVHLLATSDAPTLLAAADAFVLNSFFEGWPVAATEAWIAGLPLILSDVGGARELVARDPDRSILISNASGEANAVTDAGVERARWMARKQANASDFADAIRSVVDTVRRERIVPGAPRDAPDGVEVMIEGHARLLRRAAGSSTSGGPAAHPRSERGA